MIQNFHPCCVLGICVTFDRNFPDALSKQCTLNESLSCLQDMDNVVYINRSINNINPFKNKLKINILCLSLVNFITAFILTVYIVNR